ncbi:MAG: hypothetical protein KIT57_19945 [Blastocatellales bacterium]|nr:hypothetical protein [Blastocatellales bacterium]
MTGGSSQQITHLLLAWGEGDASALDELMPMVYNELRKVAARHLRRILIDLIRSSNKARKKPPKFSGFRCAPCSATGNSPACGCFVN